MLMLSRLIVSALLLCAGTIMAAEEKCEPFGIEIKILPEQIHNVSHMCAEHGGASYILLDIPHLDYEQEHALTIVCRDGREFVVPEQYY